MDAGAIVDAALTCLNRDEHDAVTSLSAHTSLEENICRARDHAVNGGKSTVMHHIGTSDEWDYARSGGHLGLTWDAAGARTEEPVFTGLDRFGALDYSDSDNGVAVYDTADATGLTGKDVKASVLPKDDLRIGTDGCLVTALNLHGEGCSAHAGVWSGCDGTVRSSLTTSEISGAEAKDLLDLDPSCTECADELMGVWPMPSPNWIKEFASTSAEGCLAATLSVDRVGVMAITNFNGASAAK